MAITMGIYTNANKIAKDLDRFARSQLPYATALALTRLAKGGREDVRTQAHRVFELRNPRRIEAGIRIKPANKKDFRTSTINAEIFDIDDFMALQEGGGLKRPSSGGQLAIPDELIHETKRGSKGKIRKAWKPRALYNKIKQPGRPRKWGRHRKPKPFIMHYGSGGSIAMRAGRDRFPIVYLYHFKRAGKVPPIFQFRKHCERWVISNFGREFDYSLRKAIATMA